MIYKKVCQDGAKIVIKKSEKVLELSNCQRNAGKYNCDGLAIYHEGAKIMSEVRSRR